MRKLICYVLSNKCCNIHRPQWMLAWALAHNAGGGSRRCSRRICPFSRGVRRCCCRNCCSPPAAVRRLLLTLSATFVAFRPALSPRFATEFPGISSRIILYHPHALKRNAFVMVRVNVPLAVPAGTATVSPSFAEPTADLTSPNETLFALIVAPSTWPK